MKKLIVVALFVLPGCASVEEWQHKRTMNQTVVADDASGKSRVATYRELDEEKAKDAVARRELGKQQAELAKQNREKQAEKQAELEKQEAVRNEAARVRVTADEARGYKHVSVTDFILDRKTLPLGSKRAITGFYRRFGELETISDKPVGNYSDFPRVVVLADSSPREVRAKLLAFPCRSVYCPIVLLGRTTSCTVVRGFVGPARTADVCLEVDETW